MNFRLFMAAAALSLIFSTQSIAQEPSSVALPFTRMGLNPATEATGGADMLSTSSFSTSNVAAIPFSDAKFEAAGSALMPAAYGNPYYGAKLGARIGKRIGFAASALYGGDEQYETFDDSGNATGSFTPSRFAVGCGLSVKVIEWISVGVCARYTSEKLYTDRSCTAFSADAVLMGNWKGIKAAAGIINIGEKLQDAAGRDFPLATSVSAALGYAHEFGKHGIEAELKADYYLPEGLANPVELSVGASYTFAGIVSVRGGYHYASETAVIPSFASVGVGLKVFGVRIDAAYRMSGMSGNAICAGLGYRF